MGLTLGLVSCVECCLGGLWRTCSFAPVHHANEECLSKGIRRTIYFCDLPPISVQICQYCSTLFRGETGKLSQAKHIESDKNGGTYGEAYVLGKVSSPFGFVLCGVIYHGKYRQYCLHPKPGRTQPPVLFFDSKRQVVERKRFDDIIVHTWKKLEEKRLTRIDISQISITARREKTNHTRMFLFCRSCKFYNGTVALPYIDAL